MKKRTILVFLMLFFTFFCISQPVKAEATRDCEGEYTGIVPSNNSVGICPCSNYTHICITGTHESGNNVNISFYSNYSGVWEAIQNFTNVSGSYCTFFPATYSTQYWWYVNVTEFNNDTNYNQTEVFTFATGSLEDCTAEVTVTTDSGGRFIYLIIPLFFIAAGYIIVKKRKRR
jgi:hypothetical protein